MDTRQRTLLRPLAVLLGLSLTCWLNPAPAETNDKVAQDYQRAKALLEAGQFEDAMGRFRLLESLYPDSRYAEQAPLEIGFAFYKLGDGDAAVATLERFLEQHPTHPHVPYAYYLAGLARFADSERLATAVTKDGDGRLATAAQEALTYFGLLIERYPNSQYTADARARSTALLEKMVTRQTQKSGADKSAASGDVSEFLLKQPPDHYTLQLLSAPDAATVRKVIHDNGLDKQAMVYELKQQNGSVFVLTYGIFPTQRMAMDVGSNLPASILDAQPWVRELSAVQAEIRQSMLVAAATPARRPQDKRQDARPATPPATPASVIATSPAAPAKTVEPPVATAAGNATATAASAVAAATPAPTQPTPSAATRTEPAAPADKVGGETWLLERNPSHFTIQLVALGRESDVPVYIKDRKLGGTLAYFRTRRDGKVWYALVTGSYPTKAAATAAANQLKSAGAETWIRRFGDIQALIRQQSTP